MAITKFDICSNALIMLDAATISSFDDNTKEADLCAVRYKFVKEDEQVQHTWNFNTVYAELARDTKEPTEQNWRYQFTQPTDMLRLNAVFNQNGNAISDFENRQGKIFANNERVFLKYQADASETEFPVFFREVLIYRMAAELSQAISGDQRIVDTQWNLYRDKLRTARRIDTQSNMPKRVIGTNNSPWIQGRTGNGSGIRFGY